MSNTASRGRTRRLQVDFMSSGERIMLAQQRNQRHNKVLRSELIRLNKLCAQRIGDINNMIHHIYFTEQLPRLQAMQMESGNSESILGPVPTSNKNACSASQTGRLRSPEVFAATAIQKSSHLHTNKSTGLEKHKQEINAHDVTSWRPPTYRRRFSSLVNDYNKQRFNEHHAEALREQRVEDMFHKLRQKNDREFTRSLGKAGKPDIIISDWTSTNNHMSQEMLNTDNGNTTDSSDAGIKTEAHDTCVRRSTLRPPSPLVRRFEPPIASRRARVVSE